MAFSNNAKSTAKPVPFHSPCSPVSFGQRKQGGDQTKSCRGDDPVSPNSNYKQNPQFVHRKKTRPANSLINC